MEDSFRVHLGSGGGGLSFLGIVDLIQQGNHLGRLEMLIWKQCGQGSGLGLTMIWSAGKCVGSGIGFSSSWDNFKVE